MQRASLGREAQLQGDTDESSFIALFVRLGPARPPWWS